MWLATSVLLHSILLVYVNLVVFREDPENESMMRVFNNTQLKYLSDIEPSTRQLVLVQVQTPEVAA